MAKGATLAEAMAAQKVGEFEGKDIRRTSVEIPGVAGGLRKAMKIDPLVMKQGDRGYIAIEFVVEKVRHDPIDGDAPAGDQERVHILQAVGATFVDGDLVAEAIIEQREKIRLAEDEAKGVVPLPLEGNSSTKTAAKAPSKSVARGKREPAKKDGTLVS